MSLIAFLLVGALVGVFLWVMRPYMPKPIWIVLVTVACVVLILWVLGGLPLGGLPLNPRLR